MNNSNSKEMSWFLKWPAIIILTILFWPLGIVLLIIRIAKDRRTRMAVGKTLKISAYCVFAFGIIVFLSLSEQEDKAFAVGMGIFLIILAVILWFIGNKLVKESKLFKEYLNLIVNQRIFSMQQIATITNRDVALVKNDLQKMIDKGFLPDAYINLTDYTIVVPILQMQYQPQNQPRVQEVSHQETAQARVVTCPSCGANNTIVPGQTVECEFCGSLLS